MAGVRGLCRDMATRTTRSAKGSNRLKPLASASADEEREREKKENGLGRLIPASGAGTVMLFKS